MKRTLLPMGVGLAFAAALCTSACGDDDEAATPAPLAPPTLSIVSVQGVGGPLWEPGKDPCVELGQDADQTVVVTIVATDFVLRPPGTCGSARQCGTALLRVDPSGDSDALHVQAAQTSLAAKLGDLGAGSHTFRVELRDKVGEPVITAEAGGTLFSEVTLDVKAPGGCSGVTDAGSDAGDAASDADASDADASDADASDAEAGDAEPGDAEAGDAEPGDAEAGDAASDAGSDGGDAGSDGGDAGSDGGDAAPG